MKPLLSTLGYAKGIWPYYLGVTIASVLVALTGIAVPFILSSATDLMVRVVQGGEANVSGALWLAGALLFLDVANTIIRNWGG